jgi:hypothetical protein
MCEKVGKSGLLFEGKYDCKMCSFIGRDNSDIARHLKCKKHIKSIISSVNETIDDNDSIVALEKENEKLKMQIQGKDEMIELLKKQLENQNEIIIQLSKQLENQNEIIIQLSKQQAPIISSLDASHNTVNHNKFNLNFYLNDTCKNAVTFEKFISDFHVSSELFDNFIVPNKIDADVHKTKIFGDLFHRNMCRYSQIERPIQTNDRIRNHFYYKANGVWINSQEDIKTFHKFLSKIEVDKIMKPAKEYKNENMIKGNDASEEKFDKINAGLFSELNKDKFINSFIPKYAVGKN